MSDISWLQVCAPEEAIELSAEDFCSDTLASGGSPIDDYYSYVEHLLTLGDEAALAASPTLGRLLVLGLVSGVEFYFRDLLGGVLRCCPLCREQAADQPIPFGALDYYGADSIEFGLFDAASLAGSREVRGRTQKLLAFEIKPGSSVAAALDEFDRVCHLRHAAVHARGALGRGNAAALGIDRDLGTRTMSVTLPSLHVAATVCHAVVRAYNRFVFEAIVRRWLGNDLFIGDWASDRDLFAPLFGLIYSKRDKCKPSNAYLCYRKLPFTATR